MKSPNALVVVLLGSALVAGQGEVPRLPPPPANPRPASISSPDDPGLPALIATCRTPPAPRGGGPSTSLGAGRGGGQPAGPREYRVSAIPSVVAEGQRWRFLWQEAGNNGDGIIAPDEGGLLIAQNDNSQVIRLDAAGRPSVVYSDTHTGGSLSMSKTGALFIVQRGLRTGILQLAPRRTVLANRYQGDPLDCMGGNPNDLTADSRGGVYFTMGGLYYADPQGVVTKYGEGLATNGVILSGDEKTLYVTNGPALAAFDVRADGSLVNQRAFARLEGGGNGDGSTIDAAGRVYVTTNPGVQVIAPDGAYLGIIPTPRPVISTAFGGPGKKTLFVLARGATDASGNQVANAAQVYAIDMIAQGYTGRAK
jgi:gluconolactonase